MRETRSQRSNSASKTTTGDTASAKTAPADTVSADTAPADTAFRGATSKDTGQGDSDEHAREAKGGKGSDDATRGQACFGGEARKPGGFLDGQMLIAMPGMSDERFARSVVYLCAHSEEGAMGIVINRRANKICFSELLVQLEVIDKDRTTELPRRAGSMQVLKGGPVETGRGFVLHTNDFFIDNSTLPIDHGVSLTATVDILRAIATGVGPDRAILALGYAGWSAGQLEAEIQHNGWLTVRADPSLIFDDGLDTKYERAARHLGIDLGRLSTEVGHA